MSTPLTTQPRTSDTSITFSRPAPNSWRLQCRIDLAVDDLVVDDLVDPALAHRLLAEEMRRVVCALFTGVDAGGENE